MQGGGAKVWILIGLLLLGGQPAAAQTASPGVELRLFQDSADASLVESQAHGVIPGSSTSYLLEIRNTGPRQDDFRISIAATNVPSGWTAQAGGYILDPTMVRLAAGASKVFPVTVSAPMGAAGQAIHQLSATSITDLSVRSRDLTLTTTASAEATRGLSILLLGSSTAVEPGTTRDIPVYVWNRGTTIANVSLEIVSAAGEGWSAGLLSLGRSLDRVTLTDISPGDVMSGALRVHAPSSLPGAATTVRVRTVHDASASVSHERSIPLTIASSAPSSPPASLPVSDARFPTEAVWWTGDWRSQGTAASCETHHAPNGRNVISMFAKDYRGSLAGVDPSTGRSVTATSSWDLVIFSIPNSGGCSPGSVTLVGGAENGNTGFALALNFTGVVTTTASASLILGPGITNVAEGTADACAASRPQSTLLLAGFDGSLTGRYLAPFASEPGIDGATRFDGAWDLVLARPIASSRCDTSEASFSGGSQDALGTVVALSLTTSASNARAPLPEEDARMPSEVTWWGARGWRVEGTARGCMFTDGGGTDRVMTGYLQDFVGTIRGVDPATGAALERTGQWSFVALREPSNASCDRNTVSAFGQSSESDGFVVAMALPWTPTLTPERNVFSVALGPGTYVSAAGVAAACKRYADDSVAIAGLDGTVTGRDTSRTFTPTTDRTTTQGAWDLVLVRAAGTFDCQTDAVRVTSEMSSPRAIGLALTFTGEASPGPASADPRFPTDMRWWRADDYVIEGTSADCWFTDHEGDRHVATTGFLSDFDGTITGIDASTGRALRETRQWDFVVADVPSSGECRNGNVRITGQQAGGAGFVVAFDLPSPPPSVRGMESLVLGPGTSVSGEGAAIACRQGYDQGALAVFGFEGSLTGRYTRVPGDQIPPPSARSTHEGAWDFVVARSVPEGSSSPCANGRVTFASDGQAGPSMLVALRAPQGSPTGSSTPSTIPPTPIRPTERTPCYDLLSCPIGDVSSLRSRILGVRGQVVSAAGVAVAGAPVLLLAEREGALDLLTIARTLDDGSFSIPTTTAPPAYAATVMGGHVVLADLASRPGGIPTDGLLTLDLPVPAAAAAAQHAQISEPELQLLADAFQTAKPFGVPTAAPDAPANIPLGGYAGIRGVAVRPSQAQQDARVVVVDMDDKGSPRIPDPPGRGARKYFAVQVADIEGREVPLDEIVFEFEAPADSEGKEVVLHHFRLDDQRWETVPTRRNDVGTYTASVDSLSLFAISTSQPSALGAVVQGALASPLTLPILGGALVVGIGFVALSRVRAGRGSGAGRGKPSGGAGVASGAALALRAAPLPEREAIVADLSVTAKGTPILQGVSFAFNQGEILALLGPSGSGKSTLLKALLGEVAYVGEASLFGIDPSRRDPGQKKLVGYVSQETELYPDMTLRENVEYFGRQYGLSASELKARVPTLLETLGLAERAQTRVGLLSGGQQRRASIAATLVHGPSLLILDEPTSGLDPVTRKSLWKFVRQASRELGVTVVVTTHFLDEADLADRVVILNKGKVVKAGTPQELVRALPGGGKAVVIELQVTSPAVEARMREAVAPLVTRGVVAATDLSGYSARFFTPNAQAAGRELMDAFSRAEVPVKQVTTEDCGMDAVFTYFAGERWRETEE